MPSAGADARADRGRREIPDDNAAPVAVATLYADIRATTGTPIVNLVFRRLATRDGLLERVWTALRPHYADGTLDALAGGLLDRLERDRPGSPAGGLLGAVAPAELPAVRALVRGYLVNNARNLIATRLLFPDGGGGRGAVAGMPLDRWLPPPARATPMPPSPPPGSPLHARIAALNRLGDGAEPVETASLWRHLSHWPALLDAVAEHPPLLSASPILGDLRDRALRCAEAAADGLPRPAFTPADHDALRRLVGSLADVTIPKMLPIGLLLDRALDNPEPLSEGPHP